MLSLLKLNVRIFYDDWLVFPFLLHKFVCKTIKTPFGKALSLFLFNWTDSSQCPKRTDMMHWLSLARFKLSQNYTDMPKFLFKKNYLKINISAFVRFRILLGSKRDLRLSWIRPVLNRLQVGIYKNCVVQENR